MDDAAYDRLEALGEAREEAGIPEPSDDGFWEEVCFLDLPLLSEVADNLVIGGGPIGRPLELPGAFVAVLDVKPSTSFTNWKDVEVLEVVMHDNWVQPLAGVDELARWVNERRKLGPVLVKCAQGLNRSGVIVARALMLGDGLTGREAVDLLRSKRTNALCNQMFEEWVLSHDRPNKPTLALPNQSD